VRGLRQAPWPVVFVVCTALFAALSLLWNWASGDDGLLGLALSAPLFGALMTWWLVSQRPGPDR
jgi:hypothetical protein